MIDQSDYKMFYNFFNNHPEVQLASINANPEMIRFCEKPTRKMMKIAIQKNPLVLRHIENIPEDIQLIAVQSNYRVIKYIKNPSESIKLIAKLLSE